MLRRFRTRGSALCLGLLAWSGSARADEPPTPEALLRHGVELRRQGKDAEALDEFARALALDSSPMARAQVALAEQALGRWVEAERDLTQALQATDDAWIDKNRPALDGAMAIIARHLGWIDVSVTVEGAALSLDGRDLSYGTSRVPSGAAVLLVRRAGYEPDVRRVEVPSAGHLQVNVELHPLGTAPAPAPIVLPTPTTAQPDAGRSWLAPLTLGAVGGVSVGVGAYFGVRTLHDKSDRDTHCVGGCDAIGRSADNDARTSATVSTITFATGGAMIAASAIWLLFTRRAQANVAPLLDTSSAGLMVRGSL